MEKAVLITGGAGFIASHCAAALLRSGELLVGDIRSTKTVRRALSGVDVVLHLAARVGVGQSMYEVADSADVTCRLALEVDGAVGQAFNIGSGQPVTVKQAARLLADRPPLIFEDGEQRRDFVYAGDVAEALSSLAAKMAKTPL